MKVADLQFLLLCDAASSDSLGKMSLLGIFTTITLDHLPGRCRKFSIAASMLFQDLDTEEHVIEAKIFAPDTPKRRARKPIFTDSVILQGASPFEGKTVMGVYSDVTDQKFPRAGQYVVRLYFDDEEIGHKTFTVEERKREDLP